MKTILAILVGGVVAGALDIISAFGSYVPDGATELGILQYIASGILGADAFEGGWTTGAIGLACHFGLTTAMAAVFVLAAKPLPVLLQQWCFAGALFGAATYVAMVYVVVPLSLVSDWTPAVGWSIAPGLMAHIFYVGLPIAYVARKVLRGEP